MTKQIRVRAKNDIHIDIMAGVIFEVLYSKYDYLVTAVTKNEVSLKSIEEGGCYQAITMNKNKFKELLTNRELTAVTE